MTISNNFSIFEAIGDSLKPISRSNSLVNSFFRMSESEKGLTPHRRYHFSPVQTMELNSAFSQNPYPSVKYRQELAARLGIDQKVTYIQVFYIKICILETISISSCLYKDGSRLKLYNLYILMVLTFHKEY